MPVMELQAGLVPGSYVGMGNNGTGCFTTGPGVTLGEQACFQSTIIVSSDLTKLHKCNLTNDRPALLACCLTRVATDQIVLQQLHH